MPTRNGSFRIFKLFGIKVFLHWSWFLVAVYEIQIRKGGYSSVSWNVLEYLTLFLIVLLHEFGHAFACRSVGGKADLIVLWPLGGVAYVSPPQRPGPQLWSIVAGPLVNVALFLILTALLWAGASEWSSDLGNYIQAIWKINFYLLIFNLIPVYPLDGGKILRSLLWFIFGRAHSLMVACVIGCVGAAGFIALAIFTCFTAPQAGIWLLIVCAFIIMNLFNGFRQARQLLALDKAPRNESYHCPNCHASPPIGEFWICGKCRKKFDTFATQAVCPHCGNTFERTACAECGRGYPIADWMNPTQPPSN
jgi:Zn-dependent protease